MRRPSSVLGCVVWLLWIAGVVNAQDTRQGPTGYLDPQRDAALSARLKGRFDLVIQQAQKPLFEAKDVSHVANGVALRDRVRGFIHLRGVPDKSQVVAAFLLWNLSDDKTEGSATMPVLIDGNLVVGRKTADNTDPCWGKIGNHSYIGDVTAFTNRSGGANQDYEITLPFFESSSTGGLNPWLGGGTTVLLEGASLVVIYRNDLTTGALYLFAPPGDNMFVSSTTYFLPSPGLGNGLFTMVGADGQRGGGHTNIASNETTYFDAAQIAGPPIAASDWDGSDGLTLPQLWDTHTHVVRLANNVSRVTYKLANDCLVPVGFVLDHE